MSGRSPMCRAILVVALATLLGHVCGLEIEAAHGPAEHVRSPESAPVHPEHEASDLHAASCDGIKPASMAPLVWMTDSGPMATVRLERMWSRFSPSVSSFAVSRPALFILHAALLI